jgi:effector-binding domain-containing protein
MSLVRFTGSVAFVIAVTASATAQPPAAVSAAARPKPAFEVQVKTTELVHAVVLPMKGSYQQHPDAFTQLGGYLSGKHIVPTGPAFGLYFSDPSVGEANLVWEIGFPVAAGVTVEAPYQVKDVPSSLSAVHVHQGSLEELDAAWGSLVEWVMSNGYQPATPAMQVFRNVESGSPEVEMRMPVRK